MASKRKFYVTEFKITVLSEEPLDDKFGPHVVAQKIMFGDWCGKTKQSKSIKINSVDAVKKLNEMNSDPSFFGLDESGNDSDD